MKQIPNPIKYLHPDATPENYQTIKANKITTSLEIDICYHCFYELSRYHFASGEKIDAWSTLYGVKIKGTQHLMPHINVAHLIHDVGFSK